jgi:hypothetical protein
MEKSMNKKLAEIQLIILSYLLLTSVAFAHEARLMTEAFPSDKFETRCGWLDNPTPQNVSLYDRDGEWILGTQGGYQVEGDWYLPNFKPRQWIVTNAGGYGYGCACLRLRVDNETNEILEVKSTRARPLSACRQDRSLKGWKDMFK